MAWPPRPGVTWAVVNPRSSSGRTQKRWPGLRERLEARIGPIHEVFTRAPRDAERIARDCAHAGASRLIVAGGDGTLGEVARGLLAAGAGERVALGLLPLGSGGDFARTLGIRGGVEGAIAAIAEGVEAHLDAARVQMPAAAPAERELYFVNEASSGISFEVVDRVERIGRAAKRLGGGVGFAAGALAGILRFRASAHRVRVDGELVYEGGTSLVVCANGRYFGGGMHIAPGARPDDGALDVVIVEALPKLTLLANFVSIYRGTHLAHPAVSVHRGRCIEIEPLGGRAPAAGLELDGEPLGVLPARIELLPGALRIHRPKDAAAGRA